MIARSLLFLMCLLAGTVQAADLKTLMQRVQTANPSLAAAEAAIEETEALRREAEAAFQPGVRFSGEQSFARMKQDFARSSLVLRADWTVWQPASSAAVTAADARRRQAELRRQVLMLQLEWELVQAWAAWQQLSIRLDSLRRKEAVLTDLLAQLEQGYASGQGVLSRVLVIKRRLADNRAMQHALESQRAQRQAVIEALTGRSETLKAVPAPYLSSIKALAAPEWKKTPFIELIQTRIDVARAQLRQTRDQYKGTLSVFAQGIRNDSGGRFYDDMAGARVGIQYAVPLYTGGRLEARADSQQAQLRRLSREKAAQLLTLKRMWAEAQAVLDQAAAREAALSERLRASEADEDVRRLLLSSGSLSIQTVLESALAKIDARQDLLLNRWEAWLAMQKQRYLRAKLLP